jgi:hypothetical protein
MTIFTRRSRKLINKIKELPKWPDVSSCSRHITPLRVFYSVLCQLLTLEFPILEKQCVISLYFVWWPMFKFCMLYCTAKNFHYTKNKKFCNAKKILPKNMTFLHFPKKWHYRIFYILLIVSKIYEKKLGVTMLFFQLYETIGHFGVNFVHVCRHSNELSVTKTNIIWK